MKPKHHIERRVEQKVGTYVAKVVKVLVIILLGLLFALLIGYLVMRLWNWLMPDLFGLGTLSYWQAVGLLLLAKIFFGFGPGTGHGDKKKTGKKAHFSGKCGSLRNDFSEWKLYDQFWKDEGEAAYKAYVEKAGNDEKAN